MPKKKVPIKIEKGKTPWEKVSKRLLTRWLTISHLPDYQEFCEDFADLFVEGIFQYDLAGEEVQIRHDDLCEKHGLNNVWYHKTKFESDEDIINYGVFRDDLAVEPIYHDTEDTEILTLVKDGRVHLSVRVGEKVTEEQIIGEVLDIVAEARAEKGIAQLRGKSLSGATPKDFEIFDMLESGLSFLDIIKRVWPEEYRQIRNIQGTGNEAIDLEKLQTKYVKQGKSESDAEELAWQVYYGDDSENPISSKKKRRMKYNRLMMKIYDAKKRVQKALISFF